MRGLALVLLVGCQPLAAIPVGECGNGVVEPARGEDCDSFGHDGGECSATCRFVCATAADCPLGWGCGADDVCRHALGELANPVRLGGVAAVSFSTGDLDGDRFSDAK